MNPESDPLTNAADTWRGVLACPFQSRAQQADPSLSNLVNQSASQPVTAAVIAQWFDALGQTPDLSSRLRLWRNRVLLTLAHRVYNRAAALEEVGAAMTALAEQAVAIAFNEASAQMKAQFGEAQDSNGIAQSLLVVGMGKLGGHELNVSSDIDLVLLYRSPGFSTGDSIGQGKLASSDYFARLIRLAVPLLQETTAAGFVFRVDLRLRPHGDSGPPAVSFAYLEDYLLSEGRAWERFAWSKARVIYGDDNPTDRQQLQALINPFVFRRYLDFSAIAAISDLHQKIQQEQFAKKKTTPGFDLKLGHGGIRQIEFIVQLAQVVRAGKDPSLRQANTLKALERLKLARLLDPADTQVLAQAYRLLREVEHALQWYDDQQTHWFDPTPSNKNQFISSLLGLSPEQLEAKLNQAREAVAALFAVAMGAGPPTTNQPDSNPANLFADRAFNQSDRFARQSEANQALTKRVWHLGLAQMPSQTENAAVQRWEQLLETIIGRPGYLAILEQSPTALKRLIRLLSHNPWAANYLTRYPVVIDDLLASDWLAPPDWPRVAEDLKEQLDHCRFEMTQGQAQPDVERQIDALRELHHAYTLRLLAQEIEGLLSVTTLADHLSALADLLIQACIHCLAPEIKGFAVIAYGKLGAKELGYASDLDLVFLYDGNQAEHLESYSKLVRKLTHWLTVQTGAGTLYEVDLRLRPDGDAGLVVSSIGAFTEYQEEKAWLWEHQALTRARFCAGDPTLGEQFETLRVSILSRPRQTQVVLDTVAQMRRKVHAGHPNRSDLFDIKHDTGGMVDIEFIIQALVLTRAAAHPILLANRGNVALLHKAGELNLIARTQANRVADIYIRLRKTQYDWRLNHTEVARVDPADWVDDRRQVTQLWAALFGSLPNTTQ